MRKISLKEDVKIISEKKGIPLYKIEFVAGLANGSISKWDKNMPSFEKVILLLHMLL